MSKIHDGINEATSRSSQQENLDSQLDKAGTKATYRTLFRYASQQELLVLAISAVCAAISGAAMPLMTVCRLFIPSELASARSRQSDYLTDCAGVSNRAFHEHCIGIGGAIRLHYPA